MPSNTQLSRVLVLGRIKKYTPHQSSDSNTRQPLPFSFSYVERYEGSFSVYGENQLVAKTHITLVPSRFGYLLGEDIVLAE